MISVASSPVIKDKIKILFYKKNDNVSEQLFEEFKKIFEPITDHFAECEDPIKELGVMSRVYSHILRYYQNLIKEGNKPEQLNPYFDLAYNRIYISRDIKKDKAQTKKGIVEAILNYCF